MIGSTATQQAAIDAPSMLTSKKEIASAETSILYVVSMRTSPDAMILSKGQASFDFTSFSLLKLS